MRVTRRFPPFAGPRGLTRATYHHGDLRNALVEAAITLIAEQGVDAMTLRELGRRVGVNHRAVYRHFADKRALLVAVAIAGFETLAVQLQAAMGEAMDPTERLQRLARAYVHFAIAEPARYQVMFGPRLNADGAYPELETAIAPAFDLVRQEVREGAAKGVFRPLEDRGTALGLWAALHGVASLIRLQRIRVRPEKLDGYIEGLVGLGLGGLLAG